MVAFLPMAFYRRLQRTTLFPDRDCCNTDFLFSPAGIQTDPAHPFTSYSGQKLFQAGKLSRWQQAFAEGFERWVIKVYQPALARVLEYRYTFMALCFGVLVILIALPEFRLDTFCLFSEGTK